ncbi:hypothetical protein FDP41_004557 [Naegleria fowleri]|uniref:Uncharacterized protein n=1 Tax=Naegleria fowleri TaxID=5763 RepID=A0A6A5BR15_NAEFO|nr:uncharacterized protein FDP41_004557 [Naegleria fowleri]KAF0976658.1 hypothetical protein FDP41_004557 [Naegleria fowleri]CAG4719197.1 unnamed protein product [Naegleria fowleri]
MNASSSGSLQIQTDQATKKHVTSPSPSEYGEHKKRKVTPLFEHTSSQNKQEFLRGFLKRLRTWGLGAASTSIQTLISFLTNNSNEFLDDYHHFIESAQKIKESFAKESSDLKQSPELLRERYINDTLNCYGSNSSFLFERNASIEDVDNEGEVVLLTSDEEEEEVDHYAITDQVITTSSTTEAEDMEDVTLSSGTASSSSGQIISLVPPTNTTSKSNGRNWSREKWITSLTEQLTNFNVDRLTEQQKRACKTNSHYLLESTAKEDSNKKRYRNLFTEFPALFYIYSYTNFIGRITMVKSIFEDNPDLKSLTQIPPDKIIWH